MDYMEIIGKLQFLAKQNIIDFLKNIILLT